MRTSRTAAAAALLGTTMLLTLGAVAAQARDTEQAMVAPAEAAPGQTVTVTVSCNHSEQRTITAHSPAFDGGPVTLTAGPDGRTFTGPARLAGSHSGRKASWAIDGRCPDGARFAGQVTVQHPAPHGAVHTGLGGSAVTGSGQLATGGVLVAAGIGGFWLLRRRTPSGPKP